MDPFVDTSRIPVREGSDTFWIKPRMDFGTRCRVEDTLTQMALRNGQVDNIQFTLGAQKLALAIHNIVAWEGPKFAAIACTQENIQRLDPDYPVFKKAQEEITRRNLPRETVDPNGSTTNGSQPSTASANEPAVSMTST